MRLATASVVDTLQGELISMRKIMSLMLGLSLVMGTASVAFGQEEKKEEKKKKGKKKKEDDKDKRSNTNTR
jgi:hypothetical protein